MAKNNTKQIVGILGKGEIGSAMAQICQEAGYIVYARDLNYDELKNKTIDFLHVNIPEKKNKDFVEVVVNAIKELKPKLTIINSSVSPGTTRAIFKKTKLPIVHSPVIGVHPNLYDSIKNGFRKVIGAINKQALMETKKHFNKLGLKYE
ncbi:MAG: hypothetical protein AAB546_03770, partial [Patescibacteria group bacterium]